MDFVLFLLVNAALFIRPAEILPGMEHVELYKLLIIPCLLVAFPAVLEQFRADVRSLSAQYLTGEPYGLFTEMRRVRNRIAEALDRRQWPRDSAELYLLAGCLSAFMAAAAPPMYRRKLP